LDTLKPGLDWREALHIAFNLPAFVLCQQDGRAEVVAGRYHECPDHSGLAHPGY
jgi:hypothetical protein